MFHVSKLEAERQIRCQSHKGQAVALSSGRSASAGDAATSFCMPLRRAANGRAQGSVTSE